tara:strand:+ start:197 stop:448 length:252 start_codon:yes stop_codon:yes gene_type:complete
MEDSVKDFLVAIISFRHGRSVAEQFIDTYEDPSGSVFKKQNYNALKYISEELGDLHDILLPEAIEYIKAYENSLKKFLNQGHF